MAKRILGLTTSSSGCERNWSVFEGIHTKKRNRLDATRMNNLVYVQFNARLTNKKRRKDKLETLLASDVSKAQSWIVEGCDDEVEVEIDTSQPTRDTNANILMEPDENEFVSDNTKDEMNEEEDIELESDKELDNM